MPTEDSSTIGDIVRSGAISYLGNALAFLLGYVFRKVLVRKNSRTLLGLSDQRHVSIVLPTTAQVLPGTTNITAGAGVPIMTIGVVKAFAKISGILSAAGIDAAQMSVYRADTLPTERLSDDLFILGFSKTNSVAEMIGSRYELPLYFVDHAITESCSGKALYEAIVSGGIVKSDYGLLTVVNNPFGDGTRAFLFGGCQSLGVSVAAMALDVKMVKTTHFGDSYLRYLSAALRMVGLNFVNIYLAALLGRTVNYQVVVGGSVLNNEAVSCEFHERRRIRRSKSLKRP